MNGSTNTNVFVSSNGQQIPDNFIFETVDPSQDDSDDSDSGAYNEGHGFQQTTGLKPGKKTKGRVKIKMEFIENKLRRYTTFSKRKTGIMKKAYELSTLTGTQVMLLVASETGHVYTFATRKLQPMITSDSGKALIQTCLNSPDPAPGSNATSSLEQRMNPTGFEETELSCVVPEDEPKVFETSSNNKPVFPTAAHVVTISQQQQQQAPPPSQQQQQQSLHHQQQQQLQQQAQKQQQAQQQQAQQQQAQQQQAQQQQAQQQQLHQQQAHHNQSISLAEQVNKLNRAQREAAAVATQAAKTVLQSQPEPIASTVPPTVQVLTNKEPTSNGNCDSSGSSTSSISTMQIPVILSAQGGAISMLQTPGVTMAQTISIPQLSQSSSSSSSSLSTTSSAPPASTTTSVLKPSTLSEVVTALSNQAAAAAAHSQNNASGDLNTPLPVSTPSINIMQNMTPGIVMYHTPQGVVYATPTQNIQDRTIFNFSQPPAAISMTQSDQIGVGQQFITIPVPMGGTPLMQLANPPTASNAAADDTGQGKQPPMKKMKK